MRSYKLRLLALVASQCLLFLSGCASYSSSFKPIEQEIIAQRPAEALKHLEKQNLTGKDELLHLLNKAMLLRMMEKYKESNHHFQLAKKYIEKNSAISVSEETSSFLINDGTRAFIGAPFEQVLIHLYSALNYLQLGQLDSARVEALQVDTRLRQISSEERSALLTTDPFARYLSGIIYEDLHEWSNALIAYRKAYQAYQGHRKFYSLTIPTSLKQDLLRLTEHEGVQNEFEKYKKSFALTNWPKQKTLSNQGEVILIVHNGLAPIMREHTVAHGHHNGRLVRISLPFYHFRKNGFKYAQIKSDKTKTRTDMVENINHIAQKTLHAYMPKITARTVARVIAKKVTAKQAEDHHPLAGLIVNVANFVSETADTRSWLTLPGDIHLARMPLKPGTYTINIEMMGHGGQVLSRHQFKDVKVKRGRKSYLSHHWVSPSALRSK